MSVFTLFWFDVEDYLTPASDDALAGLLRAFESCGVQATWKVVAEKARVLQERGRDDVIRLLQRQDIGYHTDTHSIHPVLAEYLADSGWEDGVEELIRREQPGYDDLVRILGPASTFGQAGGSWAPQIYPFLRHVGIRLFLDEAGHIGCDGEPFWYCGVLHVNRMQGVARMEFTEGAEGLAQGKRSFDEIRERLQGDGGGIVSIYYHPCEFSTTEFWDGVNFGRGASPPRHQWRPSALRPPGEMERALALFKDYLEYVAGRPDVECLTGRQVPNLLPDLAQGCPFAADELAAATAFAQGQVDVCWSGEVALAPAEAFALVTDALLEVFLALSEGVEAAAAAELGGGVEVVLDGTPYGPVRRLASTVPEGESVSAEAFLEAAAEARRYLRYHGRLPDAVWLGARRLAPADYLVTAADLLRCLLGGQVPAQVRVRAGQLAGERHVGADVWGWAIFPEGFGAPGLLELARLQTWTLKPAVLIT